MDFALSAYKAGSQAFFGGEGDIVIFGFVNQEVRVTPRPNLSEIMAGKELPQAPFLLSNVWAVPCVRHSRSLELGSSCRSLSLAMASQLSAELPRASAAGPEVGVV